MLAIEIIGIVFTILLLLLVIFLGAAFCAFILIHYGEIETDEDLQDNSGNSED